MIQKLQNKDLEVSYKIRSVFQVSYAVEAKLLNAVDFPPLRRSIESYVNSKNVFFGYFKNKELAGVIEIKHHNTYTHIQSLVVCPDFFRQGIAKELITYVLSLYNSKPFIVETGLKNGPASKLYRKFNFKEIKQWDTNDGVRKIRFERL